MTRRSLNSLTVDRLATLLLATFLSLSGLLAPPPLRVAAGSTDPAASPAGAPTVAITESALSDPESEPGVPLRPRPRPGPFWMNLYSEGDFVHQQTIYWCVAASVQTMINIIEDGEPDRSRRSQRRIHLEARSLDPGHAVFWRQLESGSARKRGLHGLGLMHWAGMLNADGFGPYEIDRAESPKRAMRRAAKAIRATGKPAGLVVWKGAHAWVMSGFEATADPAYTNDFKVTRVYVSDPWYPDVSSIWGRSRPPNSAITVSALRADYLPYDRPGRQHPKRDGKYMLILPTLPALTVIPEGPGQGTALAGGSGSGPTASTSTE